MGIATFMANQQIVGSSGHLHEEGSADGQEGSADGVVPAAAQEGSADTVTGVGGVGVDGKFNVEDGGYFWSDFAEK